MPTVASILPDDGSNKRHGTVQPLIQRAKNTGITSNPSTHVDGNASEDKRDSSLLPPWLDSKAVKNGRDFVSRHFFLIFFTHFISLILLLSYVPVRTVLVKTGKSHTKDLALRRYLSTLLHVKLWYESDLSDEESAGVRDILKVRKIHGGVSQRMEEMEETSDTACLGMDYADEKDNTKACELIRALRNVNPHQDKNNNAKSSLSSAARPITQLDMIATQYCFMGLLTSFPQKFGVGSTPEDLEGLKGFFHIWAVIGYLLGIEDEFNLCIGDKKNVREYILEEILLHDLFTSTTRETYGLWAALVNAMSDLVPCLSIHSALLYILDQTLRLKKSDKLYDISSSYERFCYKVGIILFTGVLNKVSGIRVVFNNLLRLAIYLTHLRLNILKIIICAK